MNLDELLKIVHERNITLWVEGKVLRFQGEAGLLDPELLAHLRRNKKALIARLSQEQNGTATEGDFTPLSIGQQAFYFLHVMHPESAAYNVASAARIGSNIDLDAMRETFLALIARHEALRTTITIHEGQPRGRIHTQGELDFQHQTVLDWTEAELQAEVRQQYLQPFDLERGPLLRVRVWTKSADDHVFLMVLHHIIFDAWSLWLVQDEFRQLYQQFTGGPQALFPKLDVRYQTFAQEQNALRANEEGARLWAYWRDRLQGELVPPDLRFDRPRRPGSSPLGDTHHFRISKELSARLRDLGRAQGATPFVVLLTIFKVLLSRYTGQVDQIVGTSTWGRSKQKYRNVVGYFVNTVPIRSDASGDPAFTNFLKHVKTRTLEALEHQDFPYSLLVDRLNFRRDARSDPLCNVVFGLQKPQQFSEVMRLFDEQANVVDWGGLEVHPFRLNQQEGQFDLTVDLFETPDSYLGALKYDPQLFDRETVERMAGHFVRLAEVVVEHPERSIGDYDFLSDLERAEVQEFCESGPRVPVSEGQVHRLFEQQADATPLKTALVCSRESLTYRELNQRANQAARLLRQRGVGEGSLVACRLERGAEAAIWLLGIWKAGGVYLPLDVSSPPARCEQILQDCGAKLLVTQSSLDWRSDRKSETMEYRTLLLEELSEDLASSPDTNLQEEISSRSLAYILHTSGSTGSPKGVCVSHAALSEHLLSIREVFGLTPHDRVLHFNSLTFDPALEQFLAPWSVGASVVMRGEELWTPEQFWEVVQAHQLTVVDLPPAYFRQCNEVLAQGVGIPRSLRLVIIGGDVFPAETLGVWKNSGVRILNSYGPTEAVITATVYDATEHDAEAHPHVPIGRPKPGMRAYVLDPRGRPVPVGVPGELHLAGPMLAEGYWKDPELTARQFPADPFAEGRMYRTGDRAAWRSDGMLDFLGRRDHQVKIHGFRVEIGEIESLLNRSDEIRQSCVLLREDSQGEPFLTAWIESNQDAELLTESLRSALKERLPKYMIPRHFVIMPRFPVTSAGKIDVKALPEPPSLARVAGEYEAPRTPQEKTLARIWSEVLEVEPVSIRHDFFDLGGGSLTSLRIVALAQEAGLKVQGQPMKPELLFEYPTIAELASHLDS